MNEKAQTTQDFIQILHLRKSFKWLYLLYRSGFAIRILDETSYLTAYSSSKTHVIYAIRQEVSKHRMRSQITESLSQVLNSETKSHR